MNGFRTSCAGLLLVLCVALSLSAPGCAKPRAPSGISNFDASGDVVLAIKHRLGRSKSHLDSENYDDAIAAMDDIVRVMNAWKSHVNKKKQLRDNPAAAQQAEQQRPEPVEFFVNVTHVPKRCKRKTKEGDTLKVHFVGKVMPKKKAFDSSFHTGSMPYKFVLGTSQAKVEGWNKGLLDMCEGERRTLLVPATLGYGDKGFPKAGVPPHANLKYMIELVEFSTGRRSRSGL